MDLVFFMTTEVLKTMPRRGWVFRGVPGPESISAHMYHMGLTCLQYPWKSDQERQRAVEMALVHDVGEAIAGDTIPADQVSRERKHEREELAMDFLECSVRESNPEFAHRIHSLWWEYENAETPVAQIVHQIDKLDALLQASVYAKRYRNVDLSDFKGHRRAITDPWLAHLADEGLAAFCPDEGSDKDLWPVSIVFVVGGPGSGKSTQCKMLVEKKKEESTSVTTPPSVMHVSVGDLLRAEQDRPGSVYGEFIRKSIRASVVVPAVLTLMLLRKTLEKAREDKISILLIDGFPRSLAQLDGFEEQVSDQYATIALEPPRDALVQRLLQRAATSGREDDNEASIHKRLATFDHDQASILQRLAKKPLVTVRSAEDVASTQVKFRSAVELLSQK